MAKTKHTDTGQFAAFEPTPEERTIVAILAAEGITQRAICRFITRPAADPKKDPEKISLQTLRRHFKRELAEGREAADAEIVNANYALMRKGNPQVTMFLAKARLGWKEVQEVHMRETYGDLVKDAHVRAEEQRKAAKLTLVGGKDTETKAA